MTNIMSSSNTKETAIKSLNPNQLDHLKNNWSFHYHPNKDDDEKRIKQGNESLKLNSKNGILGHDIHAKFIDTRTIPINEKEKN